VASGRVELSRLDGVRLRPDECGNQRPDGKDTHPDARDPSAWFRGSACSNGDPTGPINAWSPHILSTPPKILLLASCELFLASFWIYLAHFCLFASLSHFRYFSSLFLFSLFIFKLLEF